MPLDNPTAKGAAITSGNYTGDNAANKAIAHGLTETPKIVLIVNNTQGQIYWYRIFGAIAKITFITATGVNGFYAVTIANSTNFYVGDGVNHMNSANLLNEVFYWIAIA